MNRILLVILIFAFLVRMVPGLTDLNRLDPGIELIIADSDANTNEESETNENFPVNSEDKIHLYSGNPLIFNSGMLAPLFERDDNPHILFPAKPPVPPPDACMA